MTARRANPEDCDAIARIYNQGIEDRVATFETRLRTAATEATSASRHSAGYAAGFAVDHGISVRAMALVTGVAMLVPAILWTMVQRLWLPADRPESMAPRC